MNGERSRFQRPTKRSASPFTVQGAPPPPRDERLGILSSSSRAFAYGTRVASPRRGIPGCLRQRDGRGWLCLDQDQQRRKKGETRRRSQPRLSFNPPRPSSMRDRGTKMNKLNCIRLACVLACFSPCLDETKYGYPYRQPVLRRSRWYPKQDSQIALRARSLACCCLCQHRRCSAHFPSPTTSLRPRR